MKKAIKFIVRLLLLIVILTSIVWYLFVYDRVFTRDTLLSQARYHDLNGNSRISSWFYNTAYRFSGNDQDVAIELANQYRADQNFTKAELTLTKALRNAPSAELYIALSETFVAQDKLMDAVNLLNGIRDPELYAKIEGLRPAPPSADYAPGFYNDYMTIHLKSSSEKIFYTMDGTYPSVSGQQYASGIELPAGATGIRAISIDDKGLVSQVSDLDYTITGVIEPAVFVDPAIEAEVRRLLNLPETGTIYTNQLWDITSFTAPEDATLLVDVALLTNLESLTVHDHALDSLSFLSSSILLKELDLTGCQFPSEDLSVLGTLDHLTHVTLSGCSLSTVSALEAARQITYLDLSYNTIRNLDALLGMSNLEEINLQHNAVKDLTVLGYLANLKKLNLGFNSVESLAPLSGCTQMTWLDVSNNQLYSLDAVNAMTQLGSFFASYNMLTNLTPLAECKELTELNVSSNEISDLEPLVSLTKLELLDVSANHISALPDWPENCSLRVIDGSYNAFDNIDILKIMQNLTHVYMDYNLLTNIDALADCYCLVQVNVFGNQIPDVTALRSHDIIVNYDPTFE